VDDYNRRIDGTPNSQVKKIGVFVDLPVPEMIAIARRVGLDGIQLHGDELPETVGRARVELEKSDLECLLIRAVRSQPADFIGKNLDLHRQRVSAEISNWRDNDIDAILLDAAVPGEYGGTGQIIDLEALPDFDRDIPIVLAGGLTSENVGEAILKSGFHSVDVAGGVESAPGVKDHEKIRAFVDAARDAFGFDRR
jgi:phosphoribosylanthranilate isomerase